MPLPFGPSSAGIWSSLDSRTSWRVGRVGLLQARRRSLGGRGSSGVNSLVAGSTGPRVDDRACCRS